MAGLYVRSITGLLMDHRVDDPTFIDHVHTATGKCN